MLLTVQISALAEIILEVDSVIFMYSFVCIFKSATGPEIVRGKFTM